MQCKTKLFRWSIPLIVYKTDFWRQNFLKIARTAVIFAGKTVFLYFIVLHFIFFHEILHNDAKWQYLKCDRAHAKTYFFSRKCRNNRFFGIFSRFHHLFFLILYTKMPISNAQNMAELDFLENIFFRPKMPEIAVFAYFHWT